MKATHVDESGLCDWDGCEKPATTPWLRTDESRHGHLCPEHITIARENGDDVERTFTVTIPDPEVDDGEL